MGVPKFFRYISERYPCLSELAREHCIPEFDNLYLDMNGIIHNCTHPDDGNIHFSITEEEMFRDIFNYIDKLFFLIKPQRLFFLAVDGVAPRAKMNQQRSRRFRAAKDAELLSNQAKQRGEVIQSTPFDSNCITPGTEFMERLHDALRSYVKSKISTDPLWQKCRVILSGHNTPGEGEHKIMDYIRYLKSQDDFNPHTRHCLYGLDADLIILGLCTHELHFVVLREEVKFGSKAKRTSIEETRFFLLHLGLFREYLELEFASLKEYESFSMSQLVDDWVLMGFLVGNDFIPHLPCMHISSNALPLVYRTYIKVFPKLGGNINVGGTLNLDRLEIFLEALSEVEYEEFQEKYTDLQYFEAKKSKNGIDEAFDFDVSEIIDAEQLQENDDSEELLDNDLAQLIERSRKFCEGDNLRDVTSDDEEQHMYEEFEAYKRNYYIKKLNFDDMTEEVLTKVSQAYITALQWILNYYYKGVQSWGWYYPYHYAPFISDLKNFKNFKIEFDMGKPFLPFEQLLAVLPAASRNLLPETYRDLFTSPNSEIIHFYPNEFETDLNGKRHEWEAVVLIPFIDEKLLLRAMERCENETDMKINDVKRNSHGPMFQYDYTSESQGECQGLYPAKAVYDVFCTETPTWRDQISVQYDKSPLVELEGASREVFYPGFPTMKYLKFNYALKNLRVKVFDNVSRQESMVLIPERPDKNKRTDIKDLAAKIVNTTVYIGWPHLIKAKVIAVTNATTYITADGARENDSKTFTRDLAEVKEHHTSRMAIDIGDCDTLVHVKTLVGTTVSCGSLGKVVTLDVWSQSVVKYPSHLIVMDINAYNSVSTANKKVENIFSLGSRIFFVGNPYFGSEGTVTNPMLVYQCGRLQVSMTVLPDPDLSEAKNIQNYIEADYLSTYQVLSIIGVSGRCLSRLTGQMFVNLGVKGADSQENHKKVNIGLHMRFPKQNEELSGYTRKKDNTWYYSQKAIDLIEDYSRAFPMVIKYLNETANHANYEYCYESDLFPNQVGENCIAEISTWLAAQDFNKAERVPCGTKRVEKTAVSCVIEAIEKLKTLPVKTVKLQVKPHLLMKPNVNLPEQYKPNKPIKLFDRIVVVRNTYLVPVGCRGTVIGVLPITDPNPVRLECIKQTTNFLDVLLDKSIPHGHAIYDIAEGRVVRVPETAVLVIFSNNENTDKIPQPNEVTTSAATKPTERSISSTVAPVKSQSNAILKAPNVTAVENNLKYFDNDISKGNLVSKEDFWMPTAAIKAPKHYTAPLVDEKPVTPKIYPMPMEQNRAIICGSLPPPPQNVAMIPEQANDFNSSTEALKTLLGLQKPATAAEASISLPTPIVNASQFPPPPTWRNNNSQLPTPSTTEEKNKNDVPLYYYGKCLPHFAPQQQLPYVNDNFYSPTNLSQKGAFIPLQVMKTVSKLPQGPINVDKIEEKVRNCTLNSSNSLKDDGSGLVDTAAPTITAESLLLSNKAALVPKKKRRKPKIAAKFDNL